MPTNVSQEVILNQSELAYLMKLWGAKSLVGISTKPLKLTQTTETVLTNLRKKQILGKGKGRASVIDLYKAWLDALFSPKHALIVVRDLPKVGKQLLIFSSHSGTIILHSMPKEGQHRLARVTITEMQKLLDSWFPTASYHDTKSMGFKLTIDEINKTREFVESGKTEKAIELLQRLNIPKDILSEFIQAIDKRRYSGSFATLEIDRDELKQADSFSILAGESSLWLILQDAQEEDRMRIVRANGNSKDKILYAIQSLVDVGEGQFTSFVLSTESLAFSFAAINRSDLGVKLLNTMNTGNLDSTQLSSLMEQGSRTLTGLGLCDSSPKGTPILNQALEQAIFPLVKFDSILEAAITRPTLHSEAFIYIQNGRAFTSHLISGPSHILESGSHNKLVEYLIKLFGDFAQQSNIKSNGEFQIELGQIRNMLKNPSMDYSKALLQADVLPTIAPILAQDLKNQRYIAWVTRIDANNNTNLQQAREAVKPTLLLLQGDQGSWIFGFPADTDSSKGKAQTINRKNFEEALIAFLQKGS